MTRKDYVLIAAALNKAAKSRPHVISAAGNIVHADRNDQLTWFAACTEIANVLSNDNQRFDSTRFFDACGVPN